MPATRRCAIARAFAAAVVVIASSACTATDRVEIETSLGVVITQAGGGPAEARLIRGDTSIAVATPADARDYRMAMIDRPR